MTLISIVTVNLDDAAGLRATAASVSAQPRAGVEWLVVDGGSRDGSLAVIRAQGALIDRWRSGPDGGVYDAMNRGLRMARGRYVVFLNAGDRFVGPDVLGRVLEVLARPDAPDLLFAGAILDLARDRRHPRPARPADRFLRYGLPACHQATFFRRARHLETAYDPAYTVTGDYAAVARMLVGGASWACIDLAVAVRRCDPASLSERLWAVRIAEARRVQREILRLPTGARLTAGLRLWLTHIAYVCLRDRPSFPTPFGPRTIRAPAIRLCSRTVF